MRIWKKDPSDVLDWEFNWSKWLAVGETITSRTVTADTGITVDSSILAADKITVWLSGGTAGAKYKVACRIVTNQGRTAERTIGIHVEER